ncbi:MAG: haloacid dehalogenase-like hydrolase [bacterium]|nr:haloacid dehalogenase-like hydrolase [bacterium]MDE0600799.1 haloacid dehalogenase-like hydrolase [bacterium]
MADHVVWDWNGTLWDDLPQVHLAVNAALGEVGAPALGLPEYIRMFTRPLPLFYRRVLGRDITDSEWERINHRFEVSYVASLHLSGMASEALRALEAVARSGATQSILSLYPHDPLNALVHKLGIAHYFTRIDGLRGLSGGSKVGLFGNHLEAAAAGVPSHRVVMVGDTDDDLAAAREAGSTCILINHHGEQALGAGADLDHFFADGLLAALRRAGLDTLDGKASPSGRLGPVS